MLDWIKSILDNYTNGMYFPNIHIKDVIEILIVAVIVYEIMLWIKNTKAWMLLRGIIMLGVFILLHGFFRCIRFCIWRRSRSTYWLLRL